MKGDALGFYLPSPRPLSIERIDQPDQEPERDQQPTVTRRTSGRAAGRQRPCSQGHTYELCSRPDIRQADGRNFTRRCR